MANVFVIGMDPFNLETVQGLPESSRYDLHALLPLAKVHRAPSYNYDVLVREAQAQLKAFDGQVDALVTWWDFPGTALVPVLTEHWDLPGPDLRSVITLEHKYWSRLVQRLVAPEHVPAFVAFDPFSDDALHKVLDAGLTYPFWVKPVKSVASYLGFRVAGPDHFEHAMKVMRAGIGHYGDPFEQALSRVQDCPHEVARVGGRACLAESIIDGQQCTLEGYVCFGEVHVYGAVDSVRHKGTSTLRAYQYPSTLPQPILRQMQQVATEVITASGLDHSCFNIEFFYDEDHGRIWLLEINVRLSQSHCDLFAKVDGVSSQRALLDVAHGKLPRVPHRQGDHAVAAKYFLRTTRDGIVRSVPSAEAMTAVEKRFPDTRHELAVAPGTRLSTLPIQESYSYELGRVFIGADDHEALAARLGEISEMLQFDIEPIGAGP